MERSERRSWADDEYGEGRCWRAELGRVRRGPILEWMGDGDDHQRDAGCWCASHVSVQPRPRDITDLDPFRRSVKHYIGNEQEHSRTTYTSNIDDRTMREIYSHPFLRAVAVNVAAVMCSYNLVNGTWACQNAETLNGILKTDFGFQGYVISDWSATESGVFSVNSGLDMTMPGDITLGSLNSYFGSNLTTAVNNGSVAMERIDDMAERIMASYFLLGQDQSYPAVNFDSWHPLSEVNNSHVDVQDDHYQ